MTKLWLELTSIDDFEDWAVIIVKQTQELPEEVALTTGYSINNRLVTLWALAQQCNNQP